MLWVMNIDLLSQLTADRRQICVMIETQIYMYIYIYIYINIRSIIF